MVTTPQVQAQGSETTLNSPKKEDLAAILAIVVIVLFVVLFALDALGRHVGDTRYVVGSLILVVAGYLFGPKLIGREGPPGTPPNLPPDSPPDKNESENR